MTKSKKWQEYAETLKKVLALESEPVGISLIEGEPENPLKERVRICKGFIDASKGKKIVLTAGNSGCFGSSWHLGFHQFKEGSRMLKAMREFVVEGEKLFDSYDALDTLLSQFNDTPDNSQSYFTLSPLSTCVEEPQLVIFACNALEASRLLTLATFKDGLMPKIKIGGATCKMILMYPLLSGEINISFFDYTARVLSKVEKDVLLISIPYIKMCQMVENINKCSAGTAKIEFPKELRKLIQMRSRKKVQ